MGIKVEVPEAPAAEEWSEPFKLPRSEKMARLREPTMGDVIHAQKTAAADGDNGSMVAIVAAMAEVDGKRIRYEDAKRLKVRDFNAITAEARRLGFLEPLSPIEQQ